MARIPVEILVHYGVLSTNQKNGWKKELNLTSWGGDPEKYDIREWDPDHEHSSKGVRFTAEELRELRDLLNQMNLEEV